jgi:hypothetical protein
LIKVNLVRVSANKKTGPIPVSYTTPESCPDACSLKKNGCYADSGPVQFAWRKAESHGVEWNEFCDKIATLPKGQLWRHNVAGDLPGQNNEIDPQALRKLIEANKGKRGFTYTHYPLNVAENRKALALANAQGFTVNASCETYSEADQAINYGVAPVVVLQEIDAPKISFTPQGNKIVTCPATYREDVTCQSCELCYNISRRVIVGFPAHGTSKRKVINIIKAKSQ